MRTWCGEETSRTCLRVKFYQFEFLSLSFLNFLPLHEVWFHHHFDLCVVCFFYFLPLNMCLFLFPNLMFTRHLNRYLFFSLSTYLSLVFGRWSFYCSLTLSFIVVMCVYHNISPLFEHWIFPSLFNVSSIFFLLDFHHMYFAIVSLVWFFFEFIPMFSFGELLHYFLYSFTSSSIFFFHTSLCSILLFPSVLNISLCFLLLLSFLFNLHCLCC